VAMTRWSRRRFLTLTPAAIAAACSDGKEQAESTDQAPNGTAESRPAPASPTPERSFRLTIDPLTKTPHPSPLIPAPPFDFSRIVQTPDDGRVLALDASENVLARARWYTWRNEWRWVTDSVSVEGYTIRELADALGINFGLFNSATDDFRVNLPEYVHMAEMLGNKLSTGYGFWSRAIYQRFSPNDWRRILADWATLASTLTTAVPSGFPYDWSRADTELSFAQRLGARLRAQNLFDGQGDILDQTVFRPGFSNDELWKLLEFMVRVKVLKYRGRVDEWAISEVAPKLLFASPNDDAAFWYRRLGEQLVDKVFVWAHDTDPQAKLVYIEDHVHETDTENFRRMRAKTFELIRHFKDAGVPVTKVGIENYLWIYAPPQESSVLSDLKTIQSLGYEVESTETAVITQNADPFWTNRRSTSVVPNTLEVQAQVFRQMLETYLSAGADFTVAGTSDKYSWFNDVGHSEVKAMIFDDNNEPKPAYFAIRDALKRRLGI
jgi:endo-1,4-beta-xylanase